MPTTYWAALPTRISCADIRVHLLPEVIEAERGMIAVLVLRSGVPHDCFARVAQPAPLAGGFVMLYVTKSDSVHGQLRRVDSLLAHVAQPGMHMR